MSVNGKNWSPYSSQEDKVAESGLIGAACSCLTTMGQEFWPQLPWALAGLGSCGPLDRGSLAMCKRSPSVRAPGPLCRSHPGPQLHPLRLWPKSGTYPTAFIELKVGNKPSVPASVKGEWHPWGRSRLGGGAAGTRSKGGHHPQELSDTKICPQQAWLNSLVRKEEIWGLTSVTHWHMSKVPFIFCTHLSF